MWSIAYAEPVAGATEAAVSPAANLISSLLPIIVLIVVFYFFLIRPQKKKEKENRDMLQNLKVGDEICTIGGIVGKISKIKDEKIVVETGSKTEPTSIMMERWAVRNVIKRVSAD